MSITLWLQLAGGLLLLVAGGELLVRGASGLARQLGVSPLVIGLTVVAMGTSAPECVVSLLSAARGNPDIAVGNVVGSNLFNVLFILGLCAVVRPLDVAAEILRRDVPIMIGASLLLWGLGANGRIGLGEGAGLVLALVGVVAYTIRQSRTESAPIRAEFEEVLADRPPLPLGAPLTGPGSRRSGRLLPVVMVAAGLGLLVLGARWLVGSAVVLAGALGVSQAVIGLTVVAAGTSLPEVAASLIATMRGHRDIAVGNIIGSNIFNIFGIVGVASLASGGTLAVSPSIERFDLPVMTAVAVACLPLLASGRRLARWEGLLFLGYYAAYVLYLILRSSHHDAVPFFSSIMMGFALPLTAVTLLVVAYRTWKPPRRSTKT